MTRFTRARVEQEVQRLVDSRAAHVKTAVQQVEHRTDALVQADEQRTERQVRTLVKALLTEFKPLPIEPTPSLVLAVPAQLEPRAVDASPGQHELRAHDTLKLIDRIEIFVRSGRPGLSMNLDSTLASKVEIERVGAQAVALTVVAQCPPHPETLARLRHALKARGLRIASLSVVRPKAGSS